MLPLVARLEPARLADLLDAAALAANSGARLRRDPHGCRGIARVVLAPIGGANAADPDRVLPSQCRLRRCRLCGRRVRGGNAGDRQRASGVAAQAHVHAERLCGPRSGSAFARLATGIAAILLARRDLAAAVVVCARVAHRARRSNYRARGPPDHCLVLLGCTLAPSWCSSLTMPSNLDGAPPPMPSSAATSISRAS